ncbi:MoaF C-terminal domain-containing protein [Microbacterium trichothecenolyticum]
MALSVMITRRRRPEANPGRQVEDEEMAMADLEHAPRLREESAEWLNMDDFSAGIDTNRIHGSADLAGRSVSVNTDDGTLTLEFEDDTVRWEAQGFEWAGSGADRYEEVPVGVGAYWIDFSLGERRVETITVALHPERGWALVVHSQIHDEGAEVETRVTQSFHGGFIEGVVSSADAPAPTRDLIGKRTLFRYSPNHLYEHIYLSSRRFVWHNLIGEQRGHAAAEFATTYKLEDGLYFFTWREEKIPVGTCFIFDYVRGRSTGKFIGLEGNGTVANSPGGAEIIPFGFSDYAEHQEPV